MVPAVTPTAAAEDAAALVADLGSPQFAQREKAARRLIRLGVSTRAALEQAAASDDAEVRSRAREILNTINEADFLSRLELFSADYDGSHKRSLPGWSQFAAQFGTSQLSRQLFVEMQRAEPELFEALAQGPKQATALLTQRTTEILESQRESLMSIGTLASLLFVGSADGVVVDEHMCQHLYPWVVQATFQRNPQSVMWTGMLKKLVGQWIVKDDTPATANQNLMIAASLELKPEALSLASRVLTPVDAGQTNVRQVPTNARQMAILMVGRFGGPAHQAMLEKLLADQTSCGMVPTNKPPHQVELQMARRGPGHAGAHDRAERARLWI